MSWVILLVCLYISYYTFKYSMLIWKQGNKFASIFVMLMIISLIVLSIIVLFFVS